MLFDTHAHYFDEKFTSDGTDVDKLLDSINAAGVGNIINVGTDTESSAVALTQAEKHSFMYSAAGIHPSDCEKYDDLEKSLDIIRQMCQNNKGKVVAVGEIGLDYYWPGFDKDKQKLYFSSQLDLASELGLPAIVHDREAHGDCFDIIKAHKNARGVLHSYSGSLESARELIACGWYISFSGSLTFKNATRLADVAANLPHDKVLIETDCPYLTPHPFRGKRNDSGYLRYTAAKLAELWNTDLSEVEEITYTNAKEFFGV